MRTRARSPWVVIVEGGWSTGPPVELAVDFPTDVCAGDLDGDGHEDLVFSARGEEDHAPVPQSIFYGDGGGDFSDPVPLGDASGGDCAVSDLDADGHLDVVIVQHDQTQERWEIDALVFWGSANGPQEPPSTMTTHGAHFVAVGD